MMITGLLFTLAQRQAPAEGRAFPSKALTPKASASKLALIPSSGDIVVKLARTSGVVLALVGLALLGVGGVEWSFDPAIGLNIQTAVVSFTLPAGVFS
ncbi:MAG TPA: hypothetical protein DIU09_10550 [Hyphomonadaceae bacterium]|uniref:hypothetical protein n=1 Tax=Aquidulcibacter sp. TaxID=2052990 RepID=UPI00078D2F7D|nr:hypothetical protein [Aquidulcibacter sp.]AMS30152.1 hypothetical protein AEM38_12950 [Hyphomonadaceae bacterium UKL13-1]MCA3696111.1 hypothetical protein [Aquidulcibacter sp.]HCP65014.1 hypothetical protein [Hyphomonadaceae bacterium]